MKNKKKDKGIAYVIAFLAGFMGGHKFYLDKNKEGMMRMIPIGAMFLSEFLHMGRLIPLAFFAMFAWWVIDLIKLGREVDEVNEELEIPSQATEPKPQHQPAIPQTQEEFTNQPGDTLDHQLKRAKSLLQLNIVTPLEFGNLSSSIASGEFVLSQGVYHDVVNLNNMKERQTIDGFMYEMQKAQMLGFKYLEQ